MARVEVALRVVRDDHGGFSCGLGDACSSTAASSSNQLLGEQSETNLETVRVPSSSTAARPVNVMIVEDNEMQRDILEKLFETASRQHADSGSPISFRVTLARNAAEALQIATVRKDINLVRRLAHAAALSFRVESDPTAVDCGVANSLALLAAQVLLDIIMPDQNGDVLLPRLRHVVGSRTAVVAISAASKVALRP